ncbi:MAG: hypothetical protein Fur0010_14940 [Bdellovibrio sp.]
MIVWFFVFLSNVVLTKLFLDFLAIENDAIFLVTYGVISLYLNCYVLFSKYSSSNLSFMNKLKEVFRWITYQDRSSQSSFAKGDTDRFKYQSYLSRILGLIVSSVYFSIILIFLEIFIGQFVASSFAKILIQFSIFFVFFELTPVVSSLGVVVSFILAIPSMILILPLSRLLSFLFPMKTKQMKEVVFKRDVLEKIMSPTKKEKERLIISKVILEAMKNHNENYELNFLSNFFQSNGCSKEDFEIALSILRDQEAVKLENGRLFKSMNFSLTYSELCHLV